MVASESTENYLVELFSGPYRNETHYTIGTFFGTNLIKSRMIHSSMNSPFRYPGTYQLALSLSARASLRSGGISLDKFRK